MTPLSESFLDRLASAAVQEGLADAVYTTLEHADRPAARRPGRARRAPDRVRGRAGGRARWPASRPASGRGSCAPTASWRPPATRSRPTSRATTTRSTSPVDLSLARGPFRRAVLETLHREVHRGEVITYGALARRGGQPARGARDRHRLRHQPGPDRRTLPPRAAGLPQARQLRRRARSASARCSRSRARPGGPEPLRRAAAPAGGARAGGAVGAGLDADRHVRAGDPAAGARRDRLVRLRGHRGRRVRARERVRRGRAGAADGPARPGQRAARGRGRARARPERAGAWPPRPARARSCWPPRRRSAARRSPSSRRRCARCGACSSPTRSGARPPTR